MKKRIHSIGLFLLVLLMPFQMLAQELDYLRGRVLDQNTGEPVVFATVRIVGKAKGVITNMDGSFRLPSEYREAGESISISSMGYEEKVYELQKLSITVINTLYLTPGVLSLSEAIVSAKKKREPSAREIVRRAIDNIPKNYPLTNFAAVGYYRDYQMDTIGYVNLNEAILEVFDEGFNELDTATTKTRIYDYRKNEDFRRDSLAAKPYNYKDWQKVIEKAYLSAYGGNEFAILRVHDAIRNYRINSFDFINNLDKGDILKNHSFTRLFDTFGEGEPLFTVALKKVLPNYSVFGKIYVAKTDYAIHKLEYAVYDDRKQSNDIILRNKDTKGGLIFEVTTKYDRNKGGKMYLSYISFHNTFQLSIPPKFSINDVLILPSTESLKLNFNKTIAANQNLDKTDYFDIRFKGKKLKFNNKIIYNDSSILFYPDMNKSISEKMFKEVSKLSEGGADLDGFLEVKILRRLQDIDGNLLNQWTTKDFNQFREFFVQEINYGAKLPSDSLLMDKTKPLYQNQPINKPADFKEYWMNTPLPIPTKQKNALEFSKAF